jgi:acyl phosphate:glycerol-3-phosphate acyltransferase
VPRKHNRETRTRGGCGGLSRREMHKTAPSCACHAKTIAKGALPVLAFPRWTEGPLSLEVVAILCGVAAILGHFRPVFLKFGKGGKGVATAAGVVVSLRPRPELSGEGVLSLVLIRTGKL